MPPLIHGKEAYLWSREAVEILRQEFKAGSSASQIIPKLPQYEGMLPTRSAVCGKLSRLGLKREDGRRHNRFVHHLVPKAAKQQTVKRKSEPLGPPTFTEQAVVNGSMVRAFDKGIPHDQRLTLAQLCAGRCHWPVGDPRERSFFYCGATTDGDKESYCRAHRFFASYRYQQQVSADHAVS